LLGLVLASVGLYGVLAYSISRRTREIGLRVALGAQRRDVLRLVMREGAWIVSTGLGFGISLAVFFTKPLARFMVPDLRPTDPVTYGAVAMVLIGVGFAASLTPTLRALRIDPLAALRHE
jgi:putative ABC transport system permease protein